MTNSPFIPPDAELDTEIGFQEKNNSINSDRKIYAFLATVSVCFLVPFAWWTLSRNHIESECYFYALGAVHEYRANGSYEEDALNIDTEKRFDGLPKELESDKPWIEKTFKESIVYEGKSKLAYDYCIKFNR